MPFTELLLVALVWTVLSCALAPVAGRMMNRKPAARVLLTLAASSQPGPASSTREFHPAGRAA